MMPIQAALNGWRISFMRRGRKAGNWFNPDTITGNSFVYGRREKVPGRKSEKIYSLSNWEERSDPLFSIYGMVSLPS